MNRRSFLGVSAAQGLTGFAAAPFPVIDTHIHLFDVDRPQGVPWPPKNSPIYRTALPGRFRAIAAPLGVTGAIEVECSPWLEDNQWVLDVASKDPIIVGTIGNLEPDKPDFGKHLDRFSRNPLFRGIRYGNLWGRTLGDALARPAFIDGLKALASAGLTLDTANLSPSLIADAVRLTDRVPELRVVLDHVARFVLPAEPAARAACRANLRQLAARPRVWAKVSGVLRRIGGKTPVDLGAYRGTLDEIWQTFGADRVVYGSDWPNSDLWGDYATGFRIVREYFAAKGRAAEEKYFWRNSIDAYRWVKR